MHARPAVALGLCLFAIMVTAVPAAEARDRAREGDPLAYDLRVGLFPLAFQAGVSQSYFGSAARIEYALLRGLDVAAVARLPWWNVTGERRNHGYALGLGVGIHLDESLDEEKLGGTVYPADPPALSGAGSRGADRDLDVPISTRLGGPPLAPDRNRDLVGLMYNVKVLRLGFFYRRSVGSLRSPNAVDYVEIKLPLLHLGYGWGTHWNLPASVTGQPEVGHRRFFVDALGTLPGLVKQRPLFSGPYNRKDVFPLGARIGMEGSIDGLLRSMPGAGFAYSLELGALPAPYGVEGYLFVGLGLALDFATH